MRFKHKRMSILVTHTRIFVQLLYNIGKPLPPIGPCEYPILGGDFDRAVITNEILEISLNGSNSTTRPFFVRGSQSHIKVYPQTNERRAKLT